MVAHDREDLARAERVSEFELHALGPKLLMHLVRCFDQPPHRLLADAGVGDPKEGEAIDENLDINTPGLGCYEQIGDLSAVLITVECHQLDVDASLRRGELELQVLDEGPRLEKLKVLAALLGRSRAALPIRHRVTLGASIRSSCQPRVVSLRVQPGPGFFSELTGRRQHEFQGT